jgi:phosphatidylglycerophosphate synthase
VVAAVPAIAVAVATARLFDLPGTYVWTVLLGYAALSALVRKGAPRRLPRPGLGWANRVTLLRATLVLPVAALLVTPGSARGSLAWLAIALALVALALDGVDGAVARRTGSETPFGARFDMELDAFLILALAMLVWTSTPLGFWVVWMGLIRYLFVLAGWLWAPLEADLPPSFRRKLVCVVQVAALLVALVPVVPASVAAGVCAVALALLGYSFAVDVVWLVRRADRPAPLNAAR